jgi:hypothetical protein
LGSFDNSNGIRDGPLAFQPIKVVSTRFKRNGRPLGVPGVEVVSIGLVAETLSLHLLAFQVGDGAFVVREVLETSGTQTRFNLSHPAIAAARPLFVLGRLCANAPLKADPHQPSRYRRSHKSCNQGNRQ